MRIDDITIGHALPKLPVPITVSLVAGGAIATRDYFPGHHDLDEGTRLVAQIVGVAPGAVAIGQRVKVEFATFETSDGGDITLPQFRPLAAVQA